MMAEFVKDILSFSMKTMSVVLMGVNVVQGMIAPLAAEAKKFRTGKGWQHGAGNRQYDKQCGEFGASGRKSCKKCSWCGWDSCAYYHMCKPLIRLWVSEFAYKGFRLCCSLCQTSGKSNVFR